MTASHPYENRALVAAPSVDEYSRVLESLGHVQVAVDMDGVVFHVSPGWEALTGHSEEESIGRNIRELFDIDEADKGAAMQAELIARGHSAGRVEITSEAPDGSLRSYDVLIHVRYDDAAGAVGVIATLTDLTAARHAEVAAWNSQKLEAVGRLAAGIAHEINTPIQFIGDNLYFLSESFERVTALLDRYRSALDGTAGQLSWSERKEMLRSAEDQADMEFVVVEVPDAVDAALEGVQRVASIVRAMKSFGHPDHTAGQQVDVNEVVRNTLVVARNEMKYVATVDAQYGDLPHITGRPGDLGQVFLNLFVNAADAVREVVGTSGDLGAIEVRTALVDDAVVVTVSDTGNGIPDAVAPHVFEPFFTTKEVGKGTGQGLSLSHAIVDRHAGTLGFAPQAGGGTAFTVTLPVEHPTA